MTLHGDKLFTLEDARRVVDELFCDPGSRYGDDEGWRRASSEHEELFAGVLYRFTLRSRRLQTVRLQLYRGLEGIGGHLWAREVRVLHRLAVRQHVALPILRRAALDPATACGFVMTERVVQTLATEGAMAELQKHRVGALREFVSLVDALCLLHREGLSHRNLGPHAIDLIEVDPNDVPDEGPSLRLRLARFEMSDLIGNLLRTLDRNDRDEGQRFRELFLAAGPQALACFPPERLAYLYQVPDQDQLETDRSDVYSLGAVVWQWFCGPLPDDKVAAAFPAGEPYNREAYEHLNDHMRTRLRQMGRRDWHPESGNPWSQRLPTELTDILLGMLERQSLSRRSSGDLDADLTEYYESIVNNLQDTAKGVFYVGFLPKESRQTIFKWRFINHDPAYEPGRVELQQFQDADLNGATLTYSPHGFQPWGPNPADAVLYQRARHVLLGQQCAWFCELYRDRRRDCEVHQLLLIKFVLENKNTAWQLMNRRLRRSVPEGLTAIPVDMNTFGAEEIAFVEENGADWRPLLYSVRSDEALPPWHTDLERAMNAVVEWQEIELAARLYPYVLHPGENRDEVVLRYDAVRDRARYLKRAALALYKRHAGVGMGDLLPFLNEESGSVQIRVYAGSVPPRRDIAAGVNILLTPKSHLNANEILVRLDRGVVLPKEGWLRPAEDIAMDVSVRRQREAIQEFLATRALTEQIHDPSAVSVGASQWKEAAQDLLGSAREIVPQLLATQPFYALLGPPGTGKTTALTRSIEATLRRDPGVRILVSAQSHYALDNLAERIMERFHRDSNQPLALRLASDESREKVSDPMQAHLLDEVTNRTVATILDSCRRHLEAGDLGVAARPLLQRWEAEAPRVRQEIRERIRRGANLVFVTSGAATTSNLDTGVFDWVIVEEAAKAWLTELAIPLVRGIRWTVVGDYNQLKAYRRRDFDQWLSLCADAVSFDDETENSELEGLLSIGRKRKALRWVFDFFQHIFGTLPVAEQPEEAPQDVSTAALAPRVGGARSMVARFPAQPPPGKTTAPAVRPGGPMGRGPTREKPTGRLDRQFRMREPIARIVGRAFYPVCGTLDGTGVPQSWLVTDDSTERPSGVQEPAFLRDRAVVWLDTRASADEGYWINEGEVQIISRLLDRLNPIASKLTSSRKEAPVAILTPYRKQVRLLQSKDLRGVNRSQVHTIDSFQGREANLVICSLVRDTIRGDLPSANIGHLIDPTRINVMLSRARSLLVIVGRFEHYRAAGEYQSAEDETSFWRTICRTILELDALVPARQVI